MYIAYINIFEGSYNSIATRLQNFILFYFLTTNKMFCPANYHSYIIVLVYLSTITDAILFSIYYRNNYKSKIICIYYAIEIAIL